MGLKQDVINLHCDIKSALHLAANQVMNREVKHIYIRYHFIRQVVSNKMIELVKIDGKLNPADALTKVITLKIFRRNCATMQVLHEEQKWSLLIVSLVTSFFLHPVMATV